MTFSEKLDFLLQLSSTSNSVLAHRLRLDPSYISKLRHGSRILPRDSEHAPKICAFIVNQCKTGYQRKGLREAIKAAPDESDNELERKLLIWLYDNGDGAFSRDFSPPPPVPQKRIESAPRQDTLIFYGDEGRRQAALALLKLALAKGEPAACLFSSDESAAWMDQDPAFFSEWSDLLRQIILRGGKVKVIQKVSNDIDAMFDTIRRWLPFYVSGEVEVFYYPKLRDGILRRTLAVIPGTAAAFSTAIGQSSDAATFLVQDSRVVASFINEFYSYAALCKPLVEFYRIPPDRFRFLFEDFLSRGYGGIVKADGLSLATVPRSVIRSLEARITPETAAIFHRIYELWNNKLREPSGIAPISHILRLAKPEDVLAGRVVIACVGMLEGEPAYYTPEEYCAHLEYLLWLIDASPCFSLTLIRSDPCGYTLHVFEEQEVCIFRTTSPYIIFRVREPNMVHAFQEYMHSIQREAIRDRDAVKQELRGCLDKLKNRLS